MTIPIGRFFPLVCAAIILGACSQSPEQTLDGIGAVLSGKMQQQVQDDHQRLAKAVDRIDVADADRAKVWRDLVQIRTRLNDLDEIRNRLDEVSGRLAELNRLAEAVTDLRRRLDALQAQRQDRATPADSDFKALRHDIGTVANAPAPSTR